MKVLVNILRTCIIGVASLTFWSCEKDQLTMTAIYYDTQNRGGLVTTDTLILDSLIDANGADIDIYFCWRQFKIPYYLPTDGIYKDSVKEKECDMSKYPHTIKCYAYDEKNRVIKMSVNGSGEMGTWKYKYDKMDRIIAIEDWDTYFITYNDLGLIAELLQDDGVIKRRLVFSYR